MAESGRRDYDSLIHFTQLDPGEPYLFVRGRDVNAGETARAWAALAAKKRAPAAIIESMLQHADRLDAWPIKKLPDDDHMSPEERQAFGYALARRAWNHRIAVIPTEAVLLAEKRGADAAVARERHADQLLLDLADALKPIMKATGVDKDTRERAQKAIRRALNDVATRHSIAIARPPAAETEEPAGAVVSLIPPSTEGDAR